MYMHQYLNVWTHIVIYIHASVYILPPHPLHTHIHRQEDMSYTYTLIDNGLEFLIHIIQIHALYMLMTLHYTL